jgi:hypothetical protein
MGDPRLAGDTASYVNQHTRIGRTGTARGQVPAPEGPLPAAASRSRAGNDERYRTSPAHSRTAAGRQPRTRPAHYARFPGQSRRPLSGPWRPARTAARRHRDATTMPAFAVPTRPTAEGRFRPPRVPPSHRPAASSPRLQPTLSPTSRRAYTPVGRSPRAEPNLNTQKIPLRAATAARSTCSRSTPIGGYTCAWSMQTNYAS